MATSDAGVEALLVADNSNSYDTAEADYGDSDGGGATQPTSLGSKFINKKGRILNGVLAGKGGRSSKEQNSAANANHLRRYERDALAEDREPLLMEDNLREQEQEQYREDGDELEEEEEEEDDDDDDDETDDDDDMPLNAHDDETMSVLTPCSASVAATGVAAATTAAVATTATMKKRTNGGIAKRAATLAAASEATKAEKSSSGTQSKAKTGAVIAGGAAAGAYLFHKHREEKNDASSSSSTAAAPSDTANSSSTNPSSGRTKSKSGLLFLGVGAGLAAAAGGVAATSKRKSADADSNRSTTWISKDADGCWSDDVSKSTKSSRHKTRWSNQSTKPSKSGRKGFLLFGAGAAAVAAIRSRQGRKNAVDNARELTGQEGIVAANKQADGDSADSKGSRFGLGRRSLAGFRYKVTVDEPPAASEAAFVGPPRYDWIDIETAAAVKVQAAWRRYNTIKDLQRQDLYTVGMRNRGRAHRGALLYDHEYNTDGTGCLDAFDIKCGYDCGLDGYGFGTRRGMQNDDVPDFMACCGVGNLL